MMPGYIVSLEPLHWRSDEPCLPACVLATRAAALYRGLPSFKPMEVFDEATSRAVMGLLLLHDLSRPFPGEGKLASGGGSGGGKVKEGMTSNPLEIFSRTVRACEALVHLRRRSLARSLSRLSPSLSALCLPCCPVRPPLSFSQHSY